MAMHSDFFACLNKDTSVRNKSSSGGVFSLLAEVCLKKEGAVFGVELNTDYQAVYTCVTEEAGLEQIRRSKYIQSSVGFAFRDAQYRLASGQQVLFCGTPCQIAGLQGYLGCDYENLIAVDFICRGVPSPSVFKSYIVQMSKALGYQIKAVNFRDKITGWKGFSMVLSADDLQFNAGDCDKNPFMKAFLRDLTLRPSCYKCKFKGIASGSDITLADYWNVHTKFPDLDDDKGVSLVAVNSPKGRNIFSALSNNMEFYPTNHRHARKTNPSLYKSAKPHRNRALFFHAFSEEPNVVVSLLDQYATIPFGNKIKGIAFSILAKLHRFVFPRNKNKNKI
jgi:coenzyme F420-reducing hydrogenase beta subunit